MATHDQTRSNYHNGDVDEGREAQSDLVARLVGTELDLQQDVSLRMLFGFAMLLGLALALVC